MAFDCRLEVTLSTTIVLGIPEVADDCSENLISDCGTEFREAPNSLNTLTATAGISSILKARKD